METFISRPERGTHPAVLFLMDAPGKDALFREIAADTIACAEAFVRDMRDTFAGVTAAELPAALDAFGRSLALGIVRPEVVAIRRLLIGEVRGFPDLAAQYFDRAPGKVLETLAGRFAQLGQAGLLSIDDPRRAAAQFATGRRRAPLPRSPHRHRSARARDRRGRARARADLPGPLRARPLDLLPRRHTRSVPHSPSYAASPLGVKLTRGR
jgi:AefR-like transcriptional repressor, C-terminal domain